MIIFPFLNEFNLKKKKKKKKKKDDFIDSILFGHIIHNLFSHLLIL